MNNKTLLTLFSLVVLLTACGEDSPEKRYTGKWSFTTLSGEYAELWISDSALATVKGPNNIPYTFSARHRNDTTYIYDFGKTEQAFDRFVRLGVSEDKLQILQDGNKTELKLIEREVPEISNSESFKNQVLGEYQTRARKKKTK